jgi:hypothetical protein
MPFSHSQLHQAFYWATSEWSAAQITEAFRMRSFVPELLQFLNTLADVAEKLNLIAPVAEQCRHQ